ncbi:MAG: hypothetical protein JWP89_3176 [Schlesneria sp.]|nr:hypothetical protein [Schlesneria sp.]
MSEVFTVFYCWQSDTNQNHTRHLIREALDAAADRISTDPTIPFQVVILAGADNEPGLCNIPETILRRLREADAIVSDLTFVATTDRDNDPKHCSNPNVLFELGYAFKAIGPERLICVMNEEYGAGSKQIFDLAHHRRPIGYRSPKESCSRAKTVDDLSKELEEALKTVIKHGLSKGNGGDDEILHQRQLSEIEHYWQSISENRRHLPCVSLAFRPERFRTKRWADAEIIENKVRELSTRTRQSDLYPPQPKGTAPMDWGLYNDTYGTPWSLTYAGQYWTEIQVSPFAAIRLSDRDARVSPEPPPSLDLQPEQCVSFLSLHEVCDVFKFVCKLCSEFSPHETLHWVIEADNLHGRWLNLPFETFGPSKARSIKREGRMLVGEFTSDWSEVFVEFAKDFCDVFCRDGRVLPREAMKGFCK